MSPDRRFQVIANQLTLGSQLNNGLTFERAQRLYESGIIDGIDLIPTRKDTALQYRLLCEKHGVPLVAIWGPTIANVQDLLEQVKQANPPKDAVFVMAIAGIYGLQTDVLPKRYGNTLKLAQEISSTSDSLRYLVAHQSMIAELEKQKLLQPWLESLRFKHIKLIRTNGWSESRGRKHPLSWNIYEIAQHAFHNRYDTAFVPDVFATTKSDLQKNNIRMSAPQAVEVLKPTVLYLADAQVAENGEDVAEKKVPGKGNIGGELVEALQQFKTQGGETVIFKFNPENPIHPEASIKHAREWLDKYW